MLIKANETINKVYILSPEETVADIPSHIVLEAGAKAELTLVVLPGVSAELPLTVDIVGEGAEIVIAGVYVCGSDEKVNIAVDMNHKVPHCMSRQLFKGIAGGTSVVGFYGKIIVAQDAQQTEAFQENHNILLSDEAKVNAKPQLEIYADDVKCSHGATIGRLNEEEQFYMRSRGITLEEAKALQMVSFVYPALEYVADEALKNELVARLDRAVRTVL